MQDSWRIYLQIFLLQFCYSLRSFVYDTIMIKQLECDYIQLSGYGYALFVHQITMGNEIKILKGKKNKTKSKHDITLKFKDFSQKKFLHFFYLEILPKKSRR